MTLLFEEISPGIELFGKFGALETGIWLLHHNSEAVLLEMPLIEKNEKQFPFQQFKDFLTRNNINLMFITATHNHQDHFGALDLFHSKFPDTPILVSQSFFIKKNITQFASLEDLKKIKNIEPSIIVDDVPIFCFKEHIFELKIGGGEPMYLVSTPKHSLSDVMIIFRGCMISGDWWLGKGDPNTNRVPRSTIQNSISRLEQLSRNKNYLIHSIFSVHANEFRRNVDFFKLLEETRSQ